MGTIYVIYFDSKSPEGLGKKETDRRSQIDRQAETQTVIKTNAQLDKDNRQCSETVRLKNRHGESEIEDGKTLQYLTDTLGQFNFKSKLITYF